MKKKQNIQFLKIKIKPFFVIILFLLTSTVTQSQSTNPFLKKSKSKENIYSNSKRTILIVFDASGSMEDKIHGETKIHIAKRVLKEVLESADLDVNLGLRVYGSEKPSGSPLQNCLDSKLLVIPGISNRRTIINEIYKVLPQGFTPITFSLSQAIQDILPYRGDKSIILISDGLETCGGDPCLLAQNIAATNIDLKINVVGFGVKDDWEAQQQLMCVALNTQGKYYSADNADELAQGLRESINKTVTGRILLKSGMNIETSTEETEGYENLPLPKLQSEKLILRKKK